ncbi:hypothetical protein CJD36_004455 [Flavipsychrobacter stenotrophus]|uniref:PA14 domain-containing protein n=1 Tax=Flavipsychrobacter stenotrophus TaxID=2077091 RepID=A0A2S7T298_9BACT|nr:hypothetical protein [Flavipsychrobacter stenotrophus]PQJ13001.1 hypothetical protein CJD36_004455 [Flavipsychrobacter stenotrophus]
MKKYKKTIKCTAWMLLLILGTELIQPATTFALTTGPTQPEVLSFEPIGTTDMVDMFSGDFVYNIPLLDVEGYPINIAYHGGVNMEQEASWVGLGWNINPGEINRTVRGMPDDFNGDTISKQMHIRSDTTMRIGIGAGLELFGKGDPNPSIATIDLGLTFSANNYRGASADINLGVSHTFKKFISVGVNIGVGSQSGADVDYSVGAQRPFTEKVLQHDAGMGIGVNQGYSSRTGLSNINLSISATSTNNGPKHPPAEKNHHGGKGNTNSIPISGSIPIGLQNYVPVQTNIATMYSIMGRVKMGLEYGWNLGYLTGNAMQSVVSYATDGSRQSYGYLYMQNAQTQHPGQYSSILDFTRDKDGMFNETMKYLPMANMTYDIYSVSGQGTGGMFRPFRNDYGCVYDAYARSDNESNSFGLEAGLPEWFEIGGDYTNSKTRITSGPWGDYYREFAQRKSGSIYENVYLREGGELALVDPDYTRQINGFDLMEPNSGITHFPAEKINSTSKRDARGNLVYYFTAEEASITGVGSNPDIINYTSTDGFNSGPEPTKETIHRIGTGKLGRKKDQLSEIVQLQKDGRRYVYGFPAMNNIQKQATFSVNGSGDSPDGLIAFSGTDDGVNNSKGNDHFYNGSITPSYAHSFLLTSVLSTDYVDVSGNGISDDDLGSYTKLNYSLKEKDYRWRAPYFSGAAQYNPGYRMDKNDDKASYIIGSREEWLLHSIETRNFVAEFYTSVRNDACGSSDAITSTTPYGIHPYDSASAHAPSYKLDSIKLFNKHDRFINATNAIPIKTVFFVYSDTLCQGIENTLNGSGGKLTLNKIYFRYGKSQKSMISPYQFAYGYNPGYDFPNKDRWGNYKPQNHARNYEYPFVDQNDTANNLYASAWSLTRIGLPSGGVIEANYEADDYAYVQDKEANEMFLIDGIGNSWEFDGSDQLYRNKKSPNLFLYFKRRIADEIPSLGIRNYFIDTNLLYYNFRVKLRADKDGYEQVKGYTRVDSSGFCSDGIHGYILLEPVDPEGGSEVRLNPVTYTAINTGRYNIPQVMYPGSEPDWDMLHAIGHMFGNFAELASLVQNPIIPFLRKRAAQAASLNLSFIRLKSPGLHKKGGGQRVKSLLFYDSWSKLSGGNEQDATYGKKYSYKIEDNSDVSSGVASYEPLIGGDENPLRQPVPYHGAEGRHWPPMDPVDLFQELPLGESLFPMGSVGYSKVTVSSIHSDVGKSSQGLDIYRYYTAKDFPIYSKASKLVPSTERLYLIVKQETTVKAEQGFTLVMNDMHGKPKSIEHHIRKPKTGELQLISSQVYNYKHSAIDRLENNVSCLIFNKVTNQLEFVNRQLGVDADVTIDTREKHERTTNISFNINLNVSGYATAIIPILFAYPWYARYRNLFRSATVTKVVQQYGILESVETFNEGASVTQRNEVYDPETGQVVITSVDNEYGEREFTTNVPAYWAYSGMAPAYENIKYEADIARVKIDSNHIGKFYFSDSGLRVGDELLFDFTDSASHTSYRTTTWFMGTVYCLDCSPSHKEACVGSVLPRFPLNTAGWDTGNVLKDVHFKVVRSGNRNMLINTIENYSQLTLPFGTGTLDIYNGGRINLTASTYCDSNTVMPHNYLANADSINPYAIGQRGIYRLLSDYVYTKGRSNGGPGEEGLFKGYNLYSLNFYDECIRFPYNYFQPDINFTIDQNWKLVRTITKWSPFGVEIENRDATGNYSTAVFGHNEDLPVAIATNARQGEVIAEGFEDYSMLHLLYNLMGYNHSFIRPLFGTTSLGTSTQYDLLQLSNPSALSINNSAAHTGLFSLEVPTTGTGYYKVTVPVNNTSYAGLRSMYNLYYPPGVYTFSGNNEYLPFQVTPNKKFILSFWVKDVSNPANATDYTLTFNTACGVYTDLGTFPFTKKTNIIDGWQQIEATFICSASADLWLPEAFYIDDMRMFPADANIKSFVYNPINEKLMATLDENNFAKMYEYDLEGNLVRVKKETEKGVMTVSESRSNNPAN